MTKLAVIRLVAFREIKERTRSKAFRWGTLATVVIVALAVIGPSLFKDDDKRPTHTVGIVQIDSSQDNDQLERSITQLGPSLGADIKVRDVATRTEGEDLLQNKDISLLVVPRQELVTRVAVDPNVSNGVNRLTAAVTEVVRLYEGLEAQNLTGTQAAAALNHASLPLRGLELAPHRDSEHASGAAAGMIVLFVFLTLYGAFILNGVIEEKTSRVVEILLSTVRPSELLAGKVLGIAAVGGIQGVVLVTAGLLAQIAVGSESVEGLSPQVIGYSLLWFVLGFGIYSWLYACAGALVSRSEDAQNLVFPLQLPLLASYGVGLVSATTGPNPALTVMSMIPFTAPMTMLERMAAGQVPGWQVALSIGLCLVTIEITRRIAVTIFAGGILRSGQRVKLREAWKNPLA